MMYVLPFITFPFFNTRKVALVVNNSAGTPNNYTLKRKTPDQPMAVYSEDDEGLYC